MDFGSNQHPDPRQWGASPCGLGGIAQDMDQAVRLEIRCFVGSSLDEEHGGFITTLAEDWSPLPGDDKSIVHQARMTWTAAEVMRRRPDMASLKGAVEHGVRFLIDRMWDNHAGGFWWSVEESGTPRAEGPSAKHLYGDAFAIYALANAVLATGSKDALRAASEAFELVEQRARRGGTRLYHEAFDAENTPASEDSEAHDSISTPLGMCTLNTHLHLLEAYTQLFEARPDQAVRSALDRLLVIIRDEMVSPVGAVSQLFTPEGAALPTPTSYGHDIETAFLLHEAAKSLGDLPEGKTLPTCLRLCDHTLRYGLDPLHGGLCEAGSACSDPLSCDKIWWAQVEAVNGWMHFASLRPETAHRYIPAALNVWAFAHRYLWDGVHGGWHWSTDRSGSSINRRGKANAWKAAYHTTRCLLRACEKLRGFRAEAVNQGGPA